MCLPVCNLVKGTVTKNSQIDPSFRENLENQGIVTKSLPKSMYQVKLNIPLQARIVTGIAFQNINGGYEFYAPQLAESPVTVNTPGILFFPAVKGCRSMSCCVFRDFMDYLSYISLTSEDKLNLPLGCDCFVLNNIKNFSSLILDSEEYQDVYCLFPTDDLSQIMFNTLKTRNPLRVHLTSTSYSDAGSLYNYLQQVKN